MTELTLNFNYTHSAHGGSCYIDLAQCLSLLNRKMYRQGMQYVVNDIEIWSAGNAQASISALPNVWPLTNGYNKAYKVWQKSQWQVLEGEEDIAGKYRDFKIFYNHAHYLKGTDGSGSENLLPDGFELTDMAALPAGSDYDWDYSEIVLPNEGGAGVAESFYLTALGDDVNVGATGTKSCVLGYAESRSRPHLADPNTMVGVVSWMTEAFDVGDNLPEIRQDLTYHNDVPPYPIYRDSGEEAYPYGANWPAATQREQGVVQDVLSCRSGTSLAFDNTGPLMFNCGLIRIDSLADVDFGIRIKIAAGKYNGVMARPMKEAN